MRKSNRKVKLNSIMGQVHNHREYKIDVKLHLIMVQLANIKSKGSKLNQSVTMNTYRQRVNKMNRKQKEGLFGSLCQEYKKLILNKEVIK